MEVFFRIDNIVTGEYRDFETEADSRAYIAENGIADNVDYELTKYTNTVGEAPESEGLAMT